MSISDALAEDEQTAPAESQEPGVLTPSLCAALIAVIYNVMVTKSDDD
jgi:hypothetical protein